MPSQYIPVLIFALLVAAFPVAGFAVFKRFRSNSETTGTALELPQGEMQPEDAVGEGHLARLFIVATLFVIFDVAIVFLFAWAVKVSRMGWYGLIAMMVFAGILLAGYAWLYKERALDWS